MRMHFRLISLLAALSASPALSAEATAVDKVVAMQAGEIAALKAEREKMKRDLTMLWKKVDQLNTRANKLMEKNQLSESDLTQPVNTIILCQTCTK